MKEGPAATAPQPARSWFRQKSHRRAPRLAVDRGSGYAVTACMPVSLPASSLSAPSEIGVRFRFLRRWRNNSTDVIIITISRAALT